MSQPMKQTFLHGTMLLAISAALVKVIGALYKIPLNAIIGEQGFSYFNTAYEIYSVLMTLSVSGLPLAMSRMIAEASALGQYRQVHRIYSTARALFYTMGMLGSSLMILFCKQLATFQEQPDAWFAIACLGPAMFLICTMSTYRGFFQGQGNMRPTAVSQVMEAVCKLIVGMGAALILLRMTGQKSFAAGGAILGVTCSCVLSSVYLFFCYRKTKRELPVTDEPVNSYGTTLKQLLSISIPIAIGSSGISILMLLETKVYMSQLIGLGYSQDQADMMKGIYDMSKTISNMPMAFISPIAVSLMPAITAHVATGDHAAIKSTEESALRVLALIIAPCAVGLFVMAQPVMGLLGGYTGDNLVLGGNLLALLSASLIFYAMITLSSSIIQAHGHPTLPVINMFIGGVIKLATTSILSRNPHVGILGAPVGTLLGYCAIMSLNLITMRRYTQRPPAVMKQLIRPIVAAVLMGILVLAFRFGLVYLLGPDCSRLIQTALPVLLGVAVYAFAVLKLKAITREDCLLLPKGEKIADVLHL